MLYSKLFSFIKHNKFSIVFYFFLFLTSIDSYGIENSIKVAATCFVAKWADKEANIDSMENYIHHAVKDGVNLIVFPEMALIGYGLDRDKSIVKRQAETIPGPATLRLKKLADMYNIWVVIGMPEKDAKTSLFYDSAAIIGPYTETLSYRKTHTISSEPLWASEGDASMVFYTPWGLIGIGICQDNYLYPSVVRFSARHGAKIHLNPTAYSGSVFTNSSIIDSIYRTLYFNILSAWVLENSIYIISSNLVGGNFIGDSVIIGPARDDRGIKIYAGPSGYKAGIFSATLQLDHGN